MQLRKAALPWLAEFGAGMFGRFVLPGGLALLIVAVAGMPANRAAPAIGDGSRVTPLSRESCADMRLHKTLRADSVVACQRLALLKFDYFGFDGRVHDDGELVVLDAAADHVANIFTALLKIFPDKAGQIAEPLRWRR